MGWLGWKSRRSCGTPVLSVSLPACRRACAAPPTEQALLFHAQVPAALQEAVRLTLDAVASPEAAPGGGSSAAEGSAAWGCLADCMRDGSELGSRAGRGWLLQLLVTAAEHELARSGGSGEQQQGLDEPETPGAARSGGGTNGATAAPALLPEVSAHGGCQLQPGRRGMRGQGELRQLLMRALATTPDSRAADCFISAVGSLMAHVRLRCAADGWNGTDGWGGSGGDEAAATPLPPSASSASMRGASSAARLAAASPHSHSRQTSKMTAGASVDSLPDAETSAVRVVPSESGTSGQQSLPMDGAGGMWRVRPAGLRVSRGSGSVVASKQTAGGPRGGRAWQAAEEKCVVACCPAGAHPRACSSPQAKVRFKVWT